MADVLAQLQVALSDRYRLERELGQGGMATVYLATDLRHERAVAIKVLRPELSVALGPDRFLREIKTTAQLAHPHILPLLDSGEADGTLYYVMPFVAGESLRDRLTREKQLPLDDAVQIAREVADALSYAHSHGIIHRDIKPENILLEGGHAVVADFGISRALTVAGGTRLTETGLAIGTPAYMSPEQAAGERDLDGRSDVYSLGCVLYEMLIGETPYTGPSAQAILARKLSEPLPRISVVRDAVPPRVEAVISKALARLPVDRYRTAREFAAALAHPETAGTAVSSARPVRWRRRASRWGLGIVAVVILALAVAFSRRFIGPGSARAAPIERLAVLPLTNLMGDTTQNYLVDGVQDLLITELAKLPSLAVISRSSVMGYRSAPKPVPVIGRELRVDALIEGSILRKGDSLLLNVQLIDSRTDRHLWAETYARTAGDPLELPPEAAQGIAQHLGTTAGTEAATRLLHPRLVDPRAADLYLKGRHACHDWTRAGFDQGILYLRQAVDIDATFARAYAALGECYALLPLWTLAQPEEAFPKARAAVQQALTLDSTLGEAYVTHSLVTTYSDWDLRSPEGDFAQALRLSPGAVEVHLYRSNWLTYRMQFDGAVREARRAIEIDPLTTTTSLNLGWTYFNARRYSESIAQLKLTQAMDPHSAWPAAELAWNYVKQGRFAESAQACEDAMLRGDPDDQIVTAGCAWVFAHAGRVSQARRLLGVLLDIGKRHWLDPYNVAAVHEGLGDRDEAFHWLGRAFAERSAAVVGLRMDPWLDGLRGDRRFDALVARVRY